VAMISLLAYSVYPQTVEAFDGLAPVNTSPSLLELYLLEGI